ncbi:MAG: alcohol dehydrogenase catalytic domain-containing protein, partial [Candidatus Caldarchaeum sp.]
AISSCRIADGECWFCRHGFYAQCVNINIYGMGPVYGESLDGCFAELVRVPYADTVLIPAPPNVPDEKLVTVGDSLATGHQSMVHGGMREGEFGGDRLRACGALQRHVCEDSRSIPGRCRRCFR